MAEPVRYTAELSIRCSEAFPALVRRAAVRRGIKEAEWLRSAVAASLKAEGYDPAQETEYALVSNGEFVQGRHGAVSTFRPAPDDRGEWVPIETEDSQPFDPAQHWRLHPLPLKMEGGRVVRVYPVVLQSEYGQ